jgi:hypothetical protein
MEIDKTDSHIFTATTTTTRMNISLETGKLRDTHSEGKVTELSGAGCAACVTTPATLAQLCWWSG